MVMWMKALDARPVGSKYKKLSAWLDERTTRLWAAAEAEQLGYGGVAAVALATGLSRPTIHVGLQELKGSPSRLPPRQRIRRTGGGRKALVGVNPQLWSTLDRLVAPHTRGDPMNPLRWTSKSTEKLAKALRAEGFSVSARTVAGLLQAHQYSLQSNRKRFEGSNHPDRDAQFEHINRQVLAFQRQGQPVVSVDTKKKELVGRYRNGGQEWSPEGRPEEVLTHDFPDPRQGKAIPYGVYDIARNEGWVSVGVDHDTAEFAVESVLSWWRKMGRRRYPKATQLLVVADGGGSNSSRCRLWKWCLQGLADRTGLRLSVCHLPPATSKWNKIEHRMFCHITQNWRGRPLVSHEVVVQLIGSTTTEKGLHIKAELDLRSYELGRKITDEDMKAVRLQPARFHGDWNYTIKPKE
jgi:DDE family transposase